jgi:predicted cobalt transporter CbtA
MKKILKIASILAIIAGIVLIVGGVWGVKFTYKNVTQEKIMTTPDSSLPNRLVSGPMTLKAQADIIREHTLKTTGGKTYAEMPREIQKVDEKGNALFNSKGEALMTPNTARDLWVTATTLTTALNLGIITYAFSGLIILFGLVSIMTGYVFSALSKKY